MPELLIIYLIYFGGSSAITSIGKAMGYEGLAFRPTHGSTGTSRIAVTARTILHLRGRRGGHRGEKLPAKHTGRELMSLDTGPAEQKPSDQARRSRRPLDAT